MRKKKIYLETSVINFVYADDALEYKKATLDMFCMFSREQKLYDCYTSDLVTDEIARAPKEIKNQLMKVISEKDLIILKANKDAEELRDKYIEEKLIPEKYADDAYHIAIASVYNMDAIVSWNFKHIVKMKVIEGTKWINGKSGYNSISIYSPLEVIGYEI